MTGLELRLLRRKYTNNNDYLQLFPCSLPLIGMAVAGNGHLLPEYKKSTPQGANIAKNIYRI